MYQLEHAQKLVSSMCRFKQNHYSRHLPALSSIARVEASDVEQLALVIVATREEQVLVERMNIEGRHFHPRTVPSDSPLYVLRS